ncbi:prenyltransferase/squalene oxidase repeat-containing protein, partial [Patulibacter sp.]|uniref:prenyltransferase/squalene oxidase repeat-containing protein n=1 Tax=Patulibacter sp. TaxID=1912859 RepID=UPI00272419E2
MTLAAASVAAVPAVLPGRPGVPGPAAARAATAKGPLDRAVARLQAAQRDDGGFGTTPGATRSDPASSVWAALALASVGLHPADQPRRGTTALEYLEAQADDLTATEDLARLVLVLAPAGRADEPAARDAAAELVRRQRPDGGLPDGASGPARLGPTAYALLALVAVGADAGAVGRGATWL